MKRKTIINTNYSRNFKGSRLIIFLILSILLISILIGCKSISIPKEGTLAPTFTLTDSDNREVSFISFRGKVVLLEFWATY